MRSRWSDEGRESVFIVKEVNNVLRTNASKVFEESFVHYVYTQFNAFSQKEMIDIGGRGFKTVIKPLEGVLTFQRLSIAVIDCNKTGGEHSYKKYFPVGCTLSDFAFAKHHQCCFAFTAWTGAQLFASTDF